ncbi:saccharopine dehydrogenase [Rhodanobacter glycinis]|uniref:Saccharopine dehydrogenase n=1 Tax=Rhodanobacter glycinis TaxID=582702 RepID=A0A502C3F8_9GAMM|nr:saccharopine dehydrogenase NADP-binding domain-containing protein [Rhodanobacter glycinis]TPG07270.1 saccharopine dehydrogenase [Rhodanobacter glycinis]
MTSTHQNPAAAGLRSTAKQPRTIAVFGAGGHTARFVVEELLKRGWMPILSGRDATTLNARWAGYGKLETRVASVEDPASLDRALAGAVAVINCAGPFLDTAAPVIEAALRAGIHYLDLAAEQTPVLATFEHFAEPARAAGVVVVPAMAFYGGLADLLATAAMGDWTSADDVRIAIALDSWRPTRGTRLTGQRNTFQRMVYANHRLMPLADPPPTLAWQFPAPFGTQEVVAVPLSEIITISRHLRTAEVHSYMNLEPLKDLRDPATGPPTAADESGRSAQVFVADVVVRKGDEERRAVARGRDIYAVTAPLVVEAVTRIVDAPVIAAGVMAPGELFDARDFLASLSPDHLAVDIS